MRKNLGPLVNLDFLDGYLFHLMQSLVEERGIEGSGLFAYYNYRLEKRTGGLSELEELLARHLITGFKDRRVVHAGIGIGTLAAALVCNGMKVAGIEYNDLRADAAQRIRTALIATWPAVAARYEIFRGAYPGALANSNWFGPDVILVFTNVGSGWSEEALEEIIESMPKFGEVLLDLRLFGRIRDSEAERTALFDRIAVSAKWAERLPNLANWVHLARFVFK